MVSEGCFIRDHQGRPPPKTSTALRLLKKASPLTYLLPTRLGTCVFQTSLHPPSLVAAASDTPKVSVWTVDPHSGLHLFLLEAFRHPTVILGKSGFGFNT